MEDRDEKEIALRARSALTNEEHIMVRSNDGSLLFLDRSSNNIKSKDMVSGGKGGSSLINRVSLVNARPIKEVKLGLDPKARGSRPRSIEKLE